MIIYQDLYIHLQVVLTGTQDVSSFKKSKKFLEYEISGETLRPGAIKTRYSKSDKMQSSRIENWIYTRY